MSYIILFPIDSNAIDGKASAWRVAALRAGNNACRKRTCVYPYGRRNDSYYIRNYSRILAVPDTHYNYQACDKERTFPQVSQRKTRYSN